MSLIIDLVSVNIDSCYIFCLTSLLLQVIVDKLWQETELTSAIPPTELPDTFADYFTDKIANIRATFRNSHSLGGTVLLEDVSPVHVHSEFHATSDEEVTKLGLLENQCYGSSSTDKSHCRSEQYLINLSYSTGIFPENMKQAII